MFFCCLTVSPDNLFDLDNSIPLTTISFFITTSLTACILPSMRFFHTLHVPVYDPINHLILKSPEPISRTSPDKGLSL